MRHAGGCILMGKLPSILKDITHTFTSRVAVSFWKRVQHRTCEAGPHYLETAADLHASGSFGSKDQNLYIQCEPLDQHRTEHNEGGPAAVEATGCVGLREMGIGGGAATVRVVCAAGVSVSCKFRTPRVMESLAAWCCVSRLVDACSACARLVRNVSYVCSWPRVLHLTTTHTA